MLGGLEQIYSFEQVLDDGSRLGKKWPFFDQAGDDSFDQGDLGVFETLKAPTVEFQAKHVVAAGEAGFDHFKYARFAGAPITVNTDRHRMRMLRTQEPDNCRGDCFVIQ